MKYKAVAVGLEKDGHPVQCMGNNLAVIQDWAMTVALEQHVQVEVYELVEQLVTTHYPQAE